MSSGFAPLSSLVLPDQPNHKPPRSFRAASRATASPPALGAPAPEGTGTRFETTTRRPESWKRFFVRDWGEVIGAMLVPGLEAGRPLTAAFDNADPVGSGSRWSKPPDHASTGVRPFSRTRGARIDEALVLLGQNGEAEQGGVGMRDHPGRNLAGEGVLGRLALEGRAEAAAAQDVENARGDAARDINAAFRAEHDGEVAGEAAEQAREQVEGRGRAPVGAGQPGLAHVAWRVEALRAAGGMDQSPMEPHQTGPRKHRLPRDAPADPFDPGPERPFVRLGGSELDVARLRGQDDQAVSDGRERGRPESRSGAENHLQPRPGGERRAEPNQVPVRLPMQRAQRRRDRNEIVDERDAIEPERRRDPGRVDDPRSVGHGHDRTLDPRRDGENGRAGRRAGPALQGVP